MSTYSQPSFSIPIPPGREVGMDECKLGGEFNANNDKYVVQR